MEPTQTQPQTGSLFQLNIDTNANMALRGAASWAKVLAIVGFILGILFMIFGILLQSGGGRGNLLASYGIVYLVFGIIMIIGSVFALNFGNKINTALTANDQTSLGVAFGFVRNIFAFWAIICIIFTLLALLGIVNVLSRT